jgi:putative two-component system response regulator
MKTHTIIGGKMLKEIYDNTRAPYLWLGYEIAMFHHERWDGEGYPHRLAGEEIPVASRIMAIADVYDALTSERCYKTAFPHEKAKSIILEGKGRHFDPDVVDSFLRQENEWLNIKRCFKD